MGVTPNAMTEVSIVTARTVMVVSTGSVDVPAITSLNRHAQERSSTRSTYEAIRTQFIESRGRKNYSTVTDFARLRGLSTSVPLATAT